MCEHVAYKFFFSLTCYTIKLNHTLTIYRSDRVRDIKHEIFSDTPTHAQHFPEVTWCDSFDFSEMFYLYSRMDSKTFNNFVAT